MSAGLNSSGSAAEQNGLTRSFQKVVLNQKRTILSAADASCDGVSVDTRPGNRDAVEIAEIGINDGGVGYATRANAAVSFILHVSVQPGAIDHEMIHCPLCPSSTAPARGR